MTRHVLGLVGGIASGKSLVAKEFERLGARRLDADAAGHQVLRQDLIKEQLRHRFGGQVFDELGEVDRRALAAQVFGDTAEAETSLRWLEGLTHPAIGRLIDQWLAALPADVELVILDAPLLFRAGWDARCDQIVFVDATEEQRLERALLRGWTEQQFRAREAAQEPLSWKRSRSDWVIDNRGTLAATCRQVAEIWASLRSRKGRESEEFPET